MQAEAESLTLKPGAKTLKPGDCFDPALWLWAEIVWVKHGEVRIRYREIDKDSVKCLHLRATTR